MSKVVVRVEEALELPNGILGALIERSLRDSQRDRMIEREPDLTFYPATNADGIELPVVHPLDERCDSEECWYCNEYDR